MEPEPKDYVPTQVLHDFVSRIEPLDISYMLTGSMAMIRYTVFRQTAAIDIILENSNVNESDFINALEPHYYVPHRAVRTGFATGQMFNVIHIETAFKVDCVIKNSDDFQNRAFERSQRTDYYGKEICVISREDLILSKLWWARDSHSEMQLRDVKNLLRAGFDISYVEGWIDKLGITELYKKCCGEITE